ncbi:hypothetical protein HETIRDRAFT_100862 [Heterobasidion irregulare TC 32-1]|uniref:Uncharacterized protein n=1 Tax=Heterobasidion irregulare (strain TC 32-1) TaxID=747525 RepID=W4KIF2_HETIT|nr:uncharacterized protein HETIRDRAFT_100862 [Heterobasidion irregulare TC 32-1]ETW85484.1 hypothetical protein HETIRDRAFT_100862 [Heterobasidion irregulare TC 32-1]
MAENPTAYYNRQNLRSAVHRAAPSPHPQSRNYMEAPPQRSKRFVNPPHADLGATQDECEARRGRRVLDVVRSRERAVEKARAIVASLQLSALSIYQGEPSSIASGFAKTPSTASKKPSQARRRSSAS